VNERTLDTNALLKTMGVGVGVVIVLAVFGYLVNALVLGTAPGEMPNPEQITTGYWIYAACLSCVSYLLVALIGASYGFFAQRNGMDPHPGRMALGGAIALVAVGAVSATISLIITRLPRIFRESFVTAGLPSYGLFPGFVPLMMVVSVCGSLVIYAALGAAGGAIYGLIARGRSRRASATDLPTLE
jgi:hypothetical protein